MAAIDDVFAERQRQINAEGWTPEHDDAHSGREMAVAAACYALSSIGFSHEAAGEIWPKTWGFKWFKPSYPRRDLVKAGALILAEIERIDRKQERETSCSPEGEKHNLPAELGKMKGEKES